VKRVNSSRNVRRPSSECLFRSAVDATKKRRLPAEQSSYCLQFGITLITEPTNGHRQESPEAKVLQVSAFRSRPSRLRCLGWKNRHHSIQTPDLPVAFRATAFRAVAAARNPDKLSRFGAAASGFLGGAVTRA
jgi:hypothetical protein